MITELSNPGKGIVTLLFAAPIADVIGIIVVVILTILYFKSLNKKIALDEDEQNINSQATLLPSKEGKIIVINRQHGSQGRAIGMLLAQKLNVPFYSKDVLAIVAHQTGLDANYLTENKLPINNVPNSLYLSKNVGGNHD